MKEQLFVHRHCREFDKESQQAVNQEMDNCVWQWLTYAFQIYSLLRYTDYEQLKKWIVMFFRFFFYISLEEESVWLKKRQSMNWNDTFVTVGRLLKTRVYWFCLQSKMKQLTEKYRHEIMMFTQKILDCFRWSVRVCPQSKLIICNCLFIGILFNRKTSEENQPEMNLIRLKLMFFSWDLRFETWTKELIEIRIASWKNSWYSIFSFVYVQSTFLLNPRRREMTNWSIF
jgi:hypothetical protein